MALDAEQRRHRIQQYASGPSRLRAAVERVPEEARRWRPAAGEFSVHEIVCHCGDSETNAAVRLRYLLAEEDPVIVGYDPDNWASCFDYHSHPLEAALAAVDAVRANTVPLLLRLPEDAWQKAGTHTESGRYTASDWLTIYSEHLDEHVKQIDRTLEAWQASRKPSSR